ncbi:unnamed protein product, partial [Brenthis ino]
MLTSNSGFMQFEYYEKIAKEVSKHEILLKRDINTKNVRLKAQHKKKVTDAYLELAKTFYLADETAGYKLLEHLVNFCLGLICKKVRKGVHQNRYGVLSTCPSWVQSLDKPFSLMQGVFKRIRKSRRPKMARCLFCFELLGAVNRVLDNKSYESRCVLIMDKETVRNHAVSLGLSVEKIYNVWKKMYRQSVLKLDYLLEAGDITKNVAPSLQITKFEKKVLDLGLLYDLKIQVVKKISFIIDQELQVLMLLYKLMVAAQEIYDSYVTHKNGAQTGADNTIYQSCLNIKGNDDEKLNCNDTFITQNVESHLKQRNYTQETLEIWALVYLEYCRRGFDGSFVLLQKRWHELKSITRKLLNPSMRKNKQIPHVLLMSMAKRFPHIMTDDWPNWLTLVKNNQIYFESDIAALPEELKTMRLHNVKENVNVNDLLIELHDEHVDGVQVIESIIETIVIDSDSDNDIYNYNDNDIYNYNDNDKTYNNKNSIIPESTRENNITELQFEESSLPERLNNIDPSKMKTTVILEEDYDIDKELRIYEMNERNNAAMNNVVGNEFRMSNYTKVTDDTDGDVTLFKINTNFNHSSDDSIKPSSDLVEDILNGSDELEPDVVNDKDINEVVVDKKLIQLSHVILIPLENLSPWQKFSRDNVIRCKRIRTKKLSEKIKINSKQLSKCRPYMPTPNVKAQTDNQITTHTNNLITIQDNKIRKKMQNKRKFLMRYLKLSKTCCSNEFWSERNINLLEQCKPVSVTLNRLTRIAKKVELSDLDEIRRMNKTISTAQVAPITHAHSNEHALNKSIETIEQNNADKEETTKMDSCSQFDDSSSNSKTNPVMDHDEIRKQFKQIVVKKYTSNAILNKRNDTKATSEGEIKQLNNSISKDISNMLNILVNRDFKIPVGNHVPLKQKKRRRKKNDCKLPDEDDSKEVVTYNSVDEWQRQKSDRLKYFNIKPFSKGVNKKNEKDDRKEEDKKMSTEIQQDGSDDVQVKALNEVDKLLKDVSDLDTSIKTEINEIKNSINEIRTGITVNNGINEINTKTSISNEVNEINEINTGISINNGIDEINNGIDETNSEMSSDNYTDLIILNSDNDDDVKPNIDDISKLNENVNKISLNEIPVPELVKISTKSSHQTSNPTVDYNSHNVINLLSKVAYNIKSNNQNVQTKLSTVSEPPPLQLIENNHSNIIDSAPLDPLNSRSTTYYLIKAPSEIKTPLNNYPMPVIQSIESLSSGETVTLTNTDIVNKAPIKREIPGSSNVKSFKSNDPLTNKKIKKE